MDSKFCRMDFVFWLVGFQDDKERRFTFPGNAYAGIFNYYVADKMIYIGRLCTALEERDMRETFFGEEL